MKRKFKILLFVPLLLCLPACAKTQAPEPTQTIAPTATHAPTSTSTPIPSQTPTPTPTPLVSVDGGLSAILTLTNGSGRNVLVYWIDYEGEEQLFHRLKPGQSYDQPTFVDHAWRIRDEASNETIKDIMVKLREQTAPILPLMDVDLGPTLVPTNTQPPVIIEDREGCVVTEPPDWLNLHPFYGKYCDAAGIPIISSENVQDLALQQAWYIVMNMLAPRPDIREELVNRGVQFAIFSANDDVSDLPYYAFASLDPSRIFAAASGSYNNPVAANNEGNLLCWPGDQYFKGYFVTVHEFAHMIHVHGLERLDPDFDARLEQLYEDAMAAGKWEDAYASVNYHEYWAEGVTYYFNASPRQIWKHYVNKRGELREHDPALYELIDEVFRGFNWMPTCP